MQVLIGTALRADVCSYCAADCGIAITRRPDSKPFLVGCGSKCSNLFPVELESNNVTPRQCCFVSFCFRPSLSAVSRDHLGRENSLRHFNCHYIYFFFLTVDTSSQFCMLFISYCSLLRGSSLYSHTKCTVLKFILCSQSP